MFRDRLAERDPLLAVLQGRVERGPGYPDRTSRDVDAADLEHAEDLWQPPARFADQIRRRDPVVDVGHLDGFDAFVAQLADLLADRDAFELRSWFLLDDERADAV